MRTLSWRPCETTVAFTLAPATKGVPTLSSAPMPTARTWSITISWPTSAAICSTLIFSPAATLYCLPPVFMTAYMLRPFKEKNLASRLEPIAKATGSQSEALHFSTVSWRCKGALRADEFHRGHHRGDERRHMEG